MLKSLICSTLLLSSYVFAAQDQQILFVCGGNTGRSPMAEGLANSSLHHFRQNGLISISRGVNVNPKEIMPESNGVLVMKEKNIDISAHRAQPISVEDIQHASLILVMTKAHKKKLLDLDPQATDKIKLLSECANGSQQDVKDAYGHDLNFYIKTRNEIDAYISQIEANHFQCYVKKY